VLAAVSASVTLRFQLLPMLLPALFSSYSSLPVVGYTTKVPHWLEVGRIMGI